MLQIVIGGLFLVLGIFAAFELRSLYAIQFLLFIGSGLVWSGLKHVCRVDQSNDDEQFRDSFRLKGGYQSWLVNLLVVVSFTFVLVVILQYFLADLKW